MWQNFWLHALNQVYGDLGQGRRLLTSSITYELLLKSPHGAITDNMRWAFQEWGSIEKRTMLELSTEHELLKQKDENELSPAPLHAVPVSNPVGLVVAYVDGSYDPSLRTAGIGAVMVQGGTGKMIQRPSPATVCGGPAATMAARPATT